MWYEIRIYIFVFFRNMCIVLIIFIYFWFIEKKNDLIINIKIEIIKVICKVNVNNKEIKFRFI